MVALRSYGHGDAAGNTVVCTIGKTCEDGVPRDVLNRHLHADLLADERH